MKLKFTFPFSLFFSLSIFLMPAFLQSQPVKADIAFVLRGFDNSCLFCDTGSFKVHAKIITDQIGQLSFGRVQTFKIFENGIDDRSPIFMQSLRDIEVMQACLDGWPGTKWDWLRNRTDFWLVIPANYKPIVEHAIQWMKDNKKGFQQWSTSTAEGIANNSVLQSNLMRMGSSSASDYLLGMKMPADYKPEEYKATLIILHSAGANSIAGGGLQNDLFSFGVLNAQGQPYPIKITGNFNRVAYIGATPLNTNLYTVAVHEGIHTFGMGTHDLDPNQLTIDYSIMKSPGVSSINTLPAWDRYYWTKWLPQSTITTIQSEVADLNRPGTLSDTALKFILQVKAGDAQGRGGTYKELYDGKWYTYTLDAGGTLTFTDKLDKIHIIPTNYIAVIPETIKEGTSTTFIVYNDGDQPWKYQWRKNGVNITGATTATYNIPKVNSQHAGKYSIVISNPNGTLTTKEITVTVLLATGTTALKKNEFITIRPNPIKDHFYLDFNLQGLYEVDMEIIQAATGSVITSFRFIQNGGMIPASFLSSGVYFLRIKRGDTNEGYMKKVIKE